MVDKDDALSAPDFHLNTAPEMDALERAAADGKHGRNYKPSTYPTIGISHEIPGASHYVHLSLTDDEAIAGFTADALEQLSQEQDADSALAFLYIARVLAPPLAVPDMDFGRGTIDFDDVISKIGWDPRSTAERREMHRKIYQFIRFGERAQVTGKRRGSYRDKHTGEVIDTEISAPLWRIHETERPEQTTLFPAQEIPLRVELVMSRAWITLLTSPQTAQYLPMGEILGAIPGNKAAGAWARVIGLALASFWRRLPRESMDGTIKPTRRELLERYPPKTGLVEEILESPNPRRAIKYWCESLQILKESQILEDSGEVKLSYQELRVKFSRQGWADEWLNEKVELRPGVNLRAAINGRILALGPITSFTKTKKRRVKK